VVPESQPWTLPAPIRALVWWPPVALLLFVITPEAAPWAVALAGAVLAVLGTAGSVIARAVARPLARPTGAQPTAAPADGAALPGLQPVLQTELQAEQRRAA